MFMMKRKFSVMSVVLILAFLFLVVSSMTVVAVDDEYNDGSSDFTQDLNSISIDKETVTLNKGEKITLKVKGDPADVELPELIWSSEDEEVASVSGKGVITAIAEGETIVIVETEDGAVSAQCEVKVTDIVKITSIELKEKNVSLTLGEKITITPVLKPEGVDSSKLIWSSNASKIVSVNNKGMLNALDVGKAVITVKSPDGKISTTCNVTVNKVVALNEITFLKEKNTVKIGKTVSLTYKLLPENATESNLVWTSSNPSIAKVDSDGKVKGVKPGKVIVKVKDSKSGKYDTCIVTVTK